MDVFAVCPHHVQLACDDAAVYVYEMEAVAVGAVGVTGGFDGDAEWVGDGVLELAQVVEADFGLGLG